MQKYRLFDHTADIGCEIFGKTKKEIFANSVAALFDIMLEKNSDWAKSPVRTMQKSLGETVTKRYKKSSFVIPARHAPGLTPAQSPANAGGIQYFEGLPGFTLKGASRVKAGMTNRRVLQKSLEEKRITIAGNDMEDLLVNFLREVLYLFNGEKWVVAGCEIVELTPKHIVAQLTGEPYNLQKHRVQMEIKAVTYHGLSFKRTKAGWVARVIFDV